MTWVRKTDTALTHRHTMHLREIEKGAVTAEAVIGFVGLCATWSGQQDSDSWVPQSVAPVASPKRWRKLADAAELVGIWSPEEREGRPGWLLDVGPDALFHVMSAAEKRARADGRTDVRDRQDALWRDGDQCRYCGIVVDEHDRKSDRGRQFDHVTPGQPDLVVSCRGCNRAKAQRTPEQADMPLRSAPADPLLQPSSIIWLLSRGAFVPVAGLPAAPPAPLRRSEIVDQEWASATLYGTAAGRRATRPKAGPQRSARPEPGTAAPQHDQHDEHEDPRSGEVGDLPVPGRVGSGRVGSRAPDPPPPVSAPPSKPPTPPAAPSSHRRRSRGARGGRRR